MRAEGNYAPASRVSMGLGVASLADGREMFDYVIRSKRVGVRAESLSMFSSEKRLRTDIILFLQVFFPTHNTVRITNPTI